MPDAFGRSNWRTAATLLVVLAGFAGLPSQSAATTQRAAPSAATPSAAAPVGPATISDSLKRQTGYSASQLTTRQVCGTPKPGQMSCLARILIVKSTGKPAGLLRAPHASPMQATRHASPAAAAVSADQTATTAPQSGTAGFLQWAYDTTWLSANRGSGDTVAIIDAYDDPSAYSDMNAFRSANGLAALPACEGSVTTSCFDEVNQAGAASPLPRQSNDETKSWNIEESLDLDAVSSLCPLCKILMVEANSDDNGSSPDLETAAATAARLGANQISMSFGGDNSPDYTAYNDWSFANVASLAAAGDSGYLGKSKVSYPAAEPGVTAVGGTSLSTASDARGFGESVWNSDGGATGSGCDTSQAVPSYQTGVTTECTGRAYNDVSADADPNSGLDMYDSQPGTEGCGTSNNLCVVGGTSLATPLTAAYEAVAGITPGPSPAWAYTNASLLNDIVSGSDGTCPSGQLLICHAGSGWDGPTGNGSISGDVSPGAPGIGEDYTTAANPTSANVAGSINPNSGTLSATYYWQFGTTTSYGQTTPTSTSLSPGQAFAAVTGSLDDLLPCTYHYRLAASNAYGTVYGYDNTVTPTASTAIPANTAPPSVSGRPEAGQQLSAQPGTWTPDCDNATYHWQESSSANGSFGDISGATAATYTPATTDVGEYIRVQITESDSAGLSDMVASQAVGPVTTPPVITTITATPTKTKPPQKGTSTKTVRFYRCAHTCTLLKTHGATTYKPRRADDGRYIKVVTTLTQAKGKAPRVTTRWIGPITAATAGDVTITGAAHAASVLTIKGSTDTALARVRVKRRSSRTLTLAVTRRGRTATSIWAYVIRHGAVVSCTRSHSLTRPVTLSVTATRAETVKLVAVRA